MPFYLSRSFMIITNTTAAAASTIMDTIMKTQTKMVYRTSMGFLSKSAYRRCCS